MTEYALIMQEKSSRMRVTNNRVIWTNPERMANRLSAQVSAVIQNGNRYFIVEFWANGWYWRGSAERIRTAWNRGLTEYLNRK